MSRTRFLLVLDTFLLVAVVVLQVVSLTGLTVHEWLGLLVAIPLLVHLILQWQWITSTWRRAMAQKQRRAQFNFFLNTVLFVFMTVAIFSGVLESEILAPHLAIAAGRKPVWSDIHSFSTNVLVGVVALHVALNWRWIVSAIRVHVLGAARAGAAVPLTTEPEDGA